MKYQLIKPINQQLSAVEQILENRGIPAEEAYQYLNTTDIVINDPRFLDETLLAKAMTELALAITGQKKVLVVVDSDCDGFTSSALLLNFLHRQYPTWVENNIDWILHDGKQHGLADCMEQALKYDLVIVPDAGTNDLEEHRNLARLNIPVIVLDHHEADININQSPAIIINNQTCDYPNKFMSGVGIVWQFCRYWEQRMGMLSITNEFLDLVALGLMADMMSLKSIETKHLITKGFKTENIHNPFIYHMAEKNKFSLGPHITPMGAAFYIAPFVNAMVRSGEIEEKELLFQSMLEWLANTDVPSEKRGHKPGEMAKLVTEAIRVATNVKNRQTRAQDAGVDALEKMIKEKDMLKHKALVFLIDDDKKIDAEIRGLAANKFMAKYQKPCCILTKTKVMEQQTFGDWSGGFMEEYYYQGSARGCDITGIDNFRSICAAAPGVRYATGHQGAFGLSVAADRVDSFIDYIDHALANAPDEAFYQVDYIFQGHEINKDHILGIANLEDLWGKDMPEPYIAVERLRITSNMVTVYSKKNLTLKITLNNGCSIMLFNAPEDLCDLLQNRNPGYIEFNIVGRANRNEWNGFVTPQIFIEDYEMIAQSRWNF